MPATQSRERDMEQSVQYIAGLSSLPARTAAITTGISAITASAAKKIEIISIFISLYFPSLAFFGVVFCSV